MESSVKTTRNDAYRLPQRSDEVCALALGVGFASIATSN